MLKRAVRSCGDCELLVRGACVFAPKKLAAGAVITSQGAVATELSFVRHGAVSLTVLTSEGDEAHVAVRGPRTMLGVEGLRGLASPAEITAVTDVQLCAAPVRRVSEWLGPESGARCMFELTAGELIEQRRDVDLRSGTADARVARFLLLCAGHLGRGKQSPFSKLRAAAVLGLRPETLSRVLRRFGARGLIETGKSVRVLNPLGLGAVAES